VCLCVCVYTHPQAFRKIGNVLVIVVDYKIHLALTKEEYLTSVNTVLFIIV
jgi:hypothetical protein